METKLRQVTLCFLVKDRQILLAMKKRGFGEGFWNGVGGKPDTGETIEQAAIREAEEEIGVTPTKMAEVGKIDFYMQQPDGNQQVIIYLVTDWEGQPAESEEMRPQWYNQGQIPYDQMWPDDQYWLPLVLAGKYVTGRFHFDAAGQIEAHEVTAL
jgi:mutator protein MutT